MDDLPLFACPDDPRPPRAAPRAADRQSAEPGRASVPPAPAPSPEASVAGAVAGTPDAWDDAPSDPVAPLAERSRAAAASKPGGPSALAALQAGVQAAREVQRAARWHPRQDKLWVTRDGAAYSLSVRKGSDILRLHPDAVRQLGALFDVPVGLLERLAGLPNLEDCRLLNLLLWAAGAAPDFTVQAVTRDGVLTALQTGGFVALDLHALVRRLGELESRGQLRVRRYDLEGSRLWLEVEFPHLPTLDANPTLDRSNGRTDQWRPGALLVTADDGAQAITILPAIFREWGGAVLPIVSSKSDLRKRRHAQVDPDTLLRQVVGDLVATSEAPFAEAADRLRALHQRFLPSRGIHSVLESAGIPFPSASARDAAIRALAGGRPTWFRLVTAVAKELRTSPDHRRRLACGIALGRQLWHRAGRTKATPKATDRPTSS